MYFVRVRARARSTHNGSGRPIGLVLLGLLRRVGSLGFGRQAALAAARRAFPTRAHTPARRLVSLIAGSGSIGVGVALLQQADLGLTPYDVLVSGLQPRLGLSFGQTVWVVAAFFFGLAAIFRKFPSRWGVAYVFANGVAIDAVSGFINAPESMPARWTFVALSLLAICTGISLVVHSGSTGGAFELLMRAAEERGRSRQVVRTSLEVGVLLTGVLLGGKLGPATVVVAVGIGPLLGVTMQVLDDHSRGRIMRQVDATPERRHPSAVGAR